MSKSLEILVNLIRESEGCKLTAYPDPGTGGKPWTIGYGSTGRGIVRGTVWTKEKAEERLRLDASSVLSLALQTSPVLVKANSEKQAAIADFIYNLGIGNYKRSTLKKRVDAQDWNAAAVEIKRWNRAAGKALPGLTARRKKEADLLLV